ncbi:MAG: undecaprenyldiphospho-muramoylpentapeptide beta-N-acetylglucosaminyltransferase [Bacilli bacterium]|nr:undecaprenyldiphospho-muramoylpentapeptide beta-N-acetylglucosaminyltransferase [Bacilli bacterium]
MKIIVSAGGTGGHIYPALAIIEKFKEKDKNLEVIYIGTHNRMEKDIVPKQNIKYEQLEIYGFSKKLIGRDIKNLFLIRKAYKKCLRIMKKFKPDVVIGVGGYVTYPVIKAANKLKIKTFIHEQNSIPGKSNVVLSRLASLVGVSFEGSKKYFRQAKKVVYTGNPSGNRALKATKVNIKELGFNPKEKLVIVVAGSLGSATLNAKFKDFLKVAEEVKFQVLYITGNSHYDEFVKDEKFSKNVIVKPYLDNLVGVMKSADLLISRAGAGIITEALALELPAIYIPSPFVAGNHQYYNALELKKKNAAYLLEEKDFNGKLLIALINNILYDKEKYYELKHNIKKMSVINSADTIYNEIKDLVK